MKIYKQEILDGISEQVEANASVAFEAEIVPDSKYQPDKESIDKTMAGFGHSNPDQIDLYYLNSVLVSTGWNKNDDVFDASEAWAARDTPVDKQFNYMHDESDIIGHITGSTVIDENGEKIVAEEAPEKFDIITSAVLYKSWSDPELRERMSQLIDEIEEGKWAVSMECLFSNFDYSVITPDGKLQTLARNEDSAFLTKHLKVYGGTGEYEGYRVGRLLRNISFSGKGLVNKPANPRSIIFDSEKDPLNEDANLLIEEFKMSEAKKAESLKVDELEATVASVNDELETVKADHEAAIAGLTAEIADRDAKIAEMEESAKTLASDLEVAKTSLDEVTSELDAAKATIRTMERTSAAKEAGISEDKIEETLAKFESVDDEAFAAMLELVHGHVSLDHTKNCRVCDEKEAAKKAAEEAVQVVEPVVEEEVVEDVDESAVEEVEVDEAEAALVDVPDEVETGFTAAASYFRSALKTTKNLK